MADRIKHWPAFPDSSNEMCKAMQRYQINDAKADVPGLKSAVRDKIGRYLNDISDREGEDRYKRWIGLIAQGEFGFSPVEIEYLEKGIESWKFKALGTTQGKDFKGEVYKYSPAFLTSNWKLFRDALIAYRFTVIHKILPLFARLRRDLLQTKAAVCIERARYVTQFLRDMSSDKDPMMTRYAGAVAHFLNHKKPLFFDDNRLAWTTCAKPFGAPVYPEWTGMAIWPELDVISTREKNPQQLTRAEIDELNFDIFPYWMERNTLEVARKRYNNPLCMRLFERIVFFIASKMGTISHTVPYYALALEKGIEYIVEQAVPKEQALKAGGALNEEQKRSPLYPYCRRDRGSGLLTVSDALELIGCLWLKLNDNTNLMPEQAVELFGGAGTVPAVTVGGVDAEGKDAVNDLTYLMLRVTELLRMRDPSLNARYLFRSTDDKITVSAVFKHDRLKVREEIISDPDLTVTFHNGKALMGYLLNPKPDILGSMLRQDVTLDGNLNYLFKFAYMAKHLQLKVTEGL